LELTDEELVECFIAYNNDLGGPPNYIRKTSGKHNINRSCLPVLNSTMTTNLYKKAVAHFQLCFGKVDRYKQLQKVVEKGRR
jgi:hypothetical protein